MKRLFNSPSTSICRTAVIFLGLLLALSVSLSRPLAATEPGKCTGAGKAFKDFQAASPPHPATKQPFVDSKGTEKTLADFRGRGVVLNFWATWCAPCVREMLALERASAALSGSGIDVITLSEDRGGAKVITPFFERLGLRNLPVFVDLRGKVLRALKINGLPTTLLIDARGLEVGRVVGVAEWDSSDVLEFLHRCIPGAG